jgi:hypothetical protein
MTTVATAGDTQVARPLRVLVPLIKEELAAGYSAGLEHYRRAGRCSSKRRVNSNMASGGHGSNGTSSSVMRPRGAI